MSAPITPADRTAAHRVHSEDDRDIFCEEYAHDDQCDRIAQAIADAREAATTAERSACVRELMARAAQASSDGWDMVENGLALAAARIEFGVHR